MGSSPGYSANTFTRFLDRLLLHGLESFRLYYGDYRAYVLDNVDDTNKGLIRVRVPAVGDTEEVSRIARPDHVLAGKDFGFKSLPPVGSVVWVRFENGKLDMPKWGGGVWGTDHIPEELRHPDQHGWYTPRGHKILLDEKSGQESIKITHRNGATIVMDVDGNISISNANGKLVNVGLDANESGVLGDTLKLLLEEILDAISQLTVGTGVGPSTPPLNIAQFLAAKAKLKSILSLTVKVK